MLQNVQMNQLFLSGQVAAVLNQGAPGLTHRCVAWGWGWTTRAAPTCRDRGGQTFGVPSILRGKKENQATEGAKKSAHILCGFSVWHLARQMAMPSSME